MINVPLDSGLLVVEAEIFFLSTEEGGRRTPAKSGYRPNHFFDGWGYMGAIHFEHEWLHPGSYDKAQVPFIDVPELRKNLIIGKEWRIQEGCHLVGKGIIRKLISTI